jgi:hypothetical protein
MKTKEISKKRLFIEELERPQPASCGAKEGVTTLAIGEECFKGK